MRKGKWSTVKGRWRGMKKLLLFVSFLLINSASVHAMRKQEPSLVNPFLKFPAVNAPQLTQEQILTLLKRGNYSDLEYELAKGLNPKHIFEIGEYKGKSLLQVAFGNSLSNRYEIASRLIKAGANPQDLKEFYITAIKAFNPDMVKWLVEHGVTPDDDIYSLVSILEKGAQEFKKEQLAKIKHLLQGRHTLVTPIKTSTGANIRLSESVAPAVSEESLIRKKLPEKTDDLYTVLSSADERILLQALLSGDQSKLAEYLQMGVSPNFVFAVASPGNSLLGVVVTQSLKNYKELADMLLAQGASKTDLSKGLTPAIERYDFEKVSWLLDKGASVAPEALERVATLEKIQNQPSIKQQRLAEIKQLLEGKKSLLKPIIKRNEKPAAPATKRIIPHKPLPPLPFKKGE